MFMYFAIQTEVTRGFTDIAHVNQWGSCQSQVEIVYIRHQRCLVKLNLPVAAVENISQSNDR